MSLIGYKAENHPQQTERRGAVDAVDDRGTEWREWGGSRLTRIVMLLPANRVEQAWWQDHVEPFRDRPESPLRVEFLRGRMRFHRPGWVKPEKGDRPPFGCCLLIWETRVLPPAGGER